MLEVKGDLFKFLKKGEDICITTNGYVKRDGSAVMGRGVAKQITRLVPNIEKKLGKEIKNNGNCVQIICKYKGGNVISFPVKPKDFVLTDFNDVVKHMRRVFNIGDVVPGWAAKARLHIIERSCKQLVDLVNKEGLYRVFLPKVGCGAGELNWNEVKPILEEYFDNRFLIVNYKG